VEICSIDGCGKRVIARGWCLAHWKRWRRHGDPLGGGINFGERLRFFREIVLPYCGNECLVWPYTKDKHGYGRLRHNGGEAYVSRMVCEDRNGPSPSARHEAAHSCGNGHLGCCTAAHLRWATHTENQAHKKIHGTDNLGSRNPQAIVTEAQVVEIRALKGILSQSLIGKKFGISRGAVYNIIAGKNWKHVHGAEEPESHTVDQRSLSGA
jgi:hypothetical protein